MSQPETQGFQTIWNPPFELVTEFNVLRSSFSAQYGLAQGVVTYQTKSGTNALHGDGFEIIRNNFFDAKGAYNATTPIDKENNYGFAVGGPVVIPHLYNGRNKTFFYLAMEWYRENQSQVNSFSCPRSPKNRAISAVCWMRAGSRSLFSTQRAVDAPRQYAGTQFRRKSFPRLLQARCRLACCNTSRTQPSVVFR